MLHQKAPKANSIEDTKICQKENGRDVIHHVRLQSWQHIEELPFNADAKYRVPTMQNRFWEIEWENPDNQP